jgi:hypothetical protein
LPADDADPKYIKNYLSDLRESLWIRGQSGFLWAERLGSPAYVFVESLE